MYGDPIPATITNVEIEPDGSRIYTVLYTDNTEEKVRKTLSREKRQKIAQEKIDAKKKKQGENSRACQHTMI